MEADKNSVPTLVRVIVVYENKIIMAKSLQNAINAIFEPDKSDSQTIIRPLENIPLPNN